MNRFLISALFGLLVTVGILLAYILYESFGTVVIGAVLAGLFVGGVIYLIDLLTEPKSVIEK